MNPYRAYAWWPAYNLPALAFDHDEIYAKALEALRIALRTRPLAFELLPKQFKKLRSVFQGKFILKRAENGGLTFHNQFSKEFRKMI